MIEEATVDAYDAWEQATGWFTVVEEHLDLPFETDVLGVRVVVEAIDLREDNRIVAACTRGKEKQAIAIADLPLRDAEAGWRGVDRGVQALAQRTVVAGVTEPAELTGLMGPAPIRRGTRAGTGLR